jgi:hypothetical protein
VASPTTTITPSVRVIFIVRPPLIAAGKAVLANARISAQNITYPSSGTFPVLVQVTPLNT